MYQSRATMLKMTPVEIQEFVRIRREHFGNLYVHGSYWINLAGIAHNGYESFKKEVSLAKKLEFTHMVLHPGSANGAKELIEGIDALARILNVMAKKEEKITFVLENTAHGNMSVGSDIQNFYTLLTKLDKPECVSFCIDTAHAYAYGYDIVNDLEGFIEFLDKTIGINAIQLIHLNDTNEKMGSRIDRHTMIGKGGIGLSALKRFVLHPKLIDIQLIVEPPILEDDEERLLLEMIKSWHVNKE
jgi:deoxyribonuclease-4